ncbi:uncharacterized protein LOC119868084 isoform X1 [Canis lupus familiaris]|uniref:uncharacterized protein LOC119868084 isoform X1 n=1 Tax=Canis lupus familiaris TaxID=9615 RepID=UPI0018F7D708|nr:uncharacterized protein LOC119868084 isoform X1 [Canis lupus familiaris]
MKPGRTGGGPSPGPDREAGRRRRGGRTGAPVHTRGLQSHSAPRPRWRYRRAWLTARRNAAAPSRGGLRAGRCGEERLVGTTLGRGPGARGAPSCWCAGLWSQKVYTDHKSPAPPGAGPLAPALGAAAGCKALLGPAAAPGRSHPSRRCRGTPGSLGTRVTGSPAAAGRRRRRRRKRRRRRRGGGAEREAGEACRDAHVGRPGCACPRPCLHPCLCAVSGPPTSADRRLSCLQVAAQTHRDAKGKAWWESWRGLRRQPRVSSQPFLCDGKTQRGGKSTKLHSEREKSTEQAATLQETRTKGFGLDHPRRTPGTLWDDFSGCCAPAGGLMLGSTRARSRPAGPR